MIDRRTGALLFGWALLIPLAYFGPFADTRQAAWGVPVVLAASALALFAGLLHAKTDVLGHIDRFLLPRAPFVLFAGMALYAVLSFLAARRELAAMSPHMSQAGLFAQSAWTTLHGHAFANTHETVDGTLGSHLGVHFSPTLLLLVPGYALWPSPLWLLGAQAVAVALIPLPLYAILRGRMEGSAPVVLALGVLCLPAFARAGWMDVHDVMFVPVLLLAAIYALEARRRGVFLLASLAALGVREDVGITLAAIGLYAGLRGLGWRTAAFVALLGLGWFFLVVKVVMPFFWSPGLWMDPSRFFSLHMGHWGATPFEAIANVAGNPGAFLREILSADRLGFAHTLFLPTLFLPLFGSLGWVPGIPTFAASVLSSESWMRVVVKYHVILPLLFAYLATTETAGRLMRNLDRRRSASLALALIIVLGVLPALVVTRTVPLRGGPPEEPSRRVLAALPENAPIYVPLGLYPHAANREIVGCWESLGARSRDPEMRGRYAWIVLWTEGGTSPDAVLADSLGRDARFEEVKGYAPLTVFRKKQ